MERKRARIGCLAVGLVVAALVLLQAYGRRGPASARTGAGSPAGEPAAASQAPADVTALLDGLRIGDRVGKWQVAEIRSPVDRRIPVVFRAGRVGVTVYVAKKGTDPHLPPVETGRYAVFFGTPEPMDAGLGGLNVFGLVQEVAARLKRTEARVPVPGGL